MKHKNFILATTAILLTFALIFLVAHKVVMPVYGEYQKLQSDFATSVKTITVKSAQLNNVKAIVRKELNSQDTNCLYSYIQANTTNLTTEAMKLIATVIVSQSWKSNLPLGIMVGLAETRSNFNPTKVNGHLRGIYQIDEFDYLKTGGTSVRDLHSVNEGVIMGCNLMNEQVKDSMSWEDALQNFNFERSSSAFINEVFKNTTNFIGFQHDYDVKVQAKLDMKLRLALQVEQENKEG
jgi:hypothetical protein